MCLKRPNPEASGEHPYPTGGPWWEEVGMPLYLVLLRVGFAEPPGSPGAGALLPHRFTLTRTRDPSRAGTAVCFLWHFPAGHPRLAVSQHPALWSPDFPPLAVWPGAII